MLANPTIDKLQSLGLSAMAAGLADQLGAPGTFGELSFEDRLGLLVDKEADARDSRRLAARLKAAKLRYPAAIEDLDWHAPRGLKRSVVAALAQGSWVGAHHNLVVTGPTGVGKSFLACVLANAALRQWRGGRRWCCRFGPESGARSRGLMPRSTTRSWKTKGPAGGDPGIPASCTSSGQRALPPTLCPALLSEAAPEGSRFVVLAWDVVPQLVRAASRSMFRCPWASMSFVATPPAWRTSILRGLACSATGMVIVSTPFSHVALSRSRSRLCPRNS